MTEAKWLAYKNATPMLESLRGKATGRKLRLFACACCREHWPETPDPTLLRAYFVAERHADGEASEQERDELFHQTARASLDRYSYLRQTEIHEVACCDTRLRFSMLVGFAVGSQAGDLETHITSAYQRAAAQPPWGSSPPGHTNRTTYLRDIFGNPYRLITFSPSWRTDTAVSLARQMYDSRDFSASPILADALQDAGCDDIDILNHCREAGVTHVRGCWVVDHLLAKE
jgi:hypothetical protein